MERFLPNSLPILKIIDYSSKNIELKLLPEFKEHRKRKRWYDSFDNFIKKLKEQF